MSLSSPGERASHDRPFARPVPVARRERGRDGGGGDHWRPRPVRLLLALGLIALGVVLSLLNPAPRPQTPIVGHGPLALATQRLSGLRVRPALLTPGSATTPTILFIAFHNDGPLPRAVTASDLFIQVGPRLRRAYPAGSRPLPHIRLAINGVISGQIAVSVVLVPGATLLYRPPWAEGATLYWRLWH